MNNFSSFTIDGTSPFLNYTPYSDGFGLSNGWQPWFSTSGVNTQGGEFGVGDSYHNTSLPGASVAFQFYGTGIDLYGGSNSSYDVSLDNNVSTNLTASDDLLFSVSKLVVGTHFVKLTARPTDPTQQLAFNRAVLAAPMDPSVTQTPKMVTVDNTNTSALSYGGSWTVPSDPQGQIPSPYHTTGDPGASVSMNFTGATAISANGVANWGHSIYSVTLDGVQNLYNGSTFWLVPDALLFYQAGLDPEKTYTINMTDVSPDTVKFSFNRFTIYQVASTDASAPTPSNTLTNGPDSTGSSGSSGSTHKPLNAGVIVGPVVAVIVVALATAAALLLRKRRQSRKLRRSLILSEHETFEPFQSFQANHVFPRTRKSLPAIPEPYAQGAHPAYASIPNPKGRSPSGLVDLPRSRSLRGLSSQELVPESPPQNIPTQADGNPVVERILQIIADRIDHSAPVAHDSTSPPQYQSPVR